MMVLKIMALEKLMYTLHCHECCVSLLKMANTGHLSNPLTNAILRVSKHFKKFLFNDVSLNMTNVSDTNLTVIKTQTTGIDTQKEKTTQIFPFTNYCT